MKEIMDKEKECGHGQSFVTIKINGVSKEIHRGHTSVQEIKALGGVPQADELNQVINGVLTLLPNDGFVVIKGDEQFVSQPQSGASS